MARARKKATKNIEVYTHPGKERVNNPPVGLVTPDTDKDAGRQTYAYDPHLDPQLQWAGKAEHYPPHPGPVPAGRPEKTPAYHPEYDQAGPAYLGGDPF